MSNSEFRLDRIGQIALTVDELPTATAYYRDVLGMKFLFDAPGMSFFDCGGIRLMLGIAEGSAEHPDTIIYYRVEDVEAACEVLRTRGATVERKPRPVHKAEDHELWLAFLRDPAGHLVGLMAEVELA